MLLTSPLPVQRGDAALVHDDAVAVDDVNAEEQGNGIVAGGHLSVQLLL